MNDDRTHVGPFLQTTVSPNLFFRRSSAARRLTALRSLEFFTVNICNRDTRAAYARAAGVFLHLCDGRGIDAIGACSAGFMGPHIAGFG
jgi:hypothetical protein